MACSTAECIGWVIGIMLLFFGAAAGLWFAYVAWQDAESIMLTTSCVVLRYVFDELSSCIP